MGEDFNLPPSAHLSKTAFILLRYDQSETRRAQPSSLRYSKILAAVEVYAVSQWRSSSVKGSVDVLVAYTTPRVWSSWRIGTARELVQRALVRAWGRRRGPITTRVGSRVRSTSSIALLSVVVSGREGASAIPEDDCALGERSLASMRPTQPALSSSRTSSTITQGEEKGSRLFGV